MHVWTCFKYAINNLKRQDYRANIAILMLNTYAKNNKHMITKNARPMKYFQIKIDRK